LNSGTTAEKLAKTIKGLLFFAAPCMPRRYTVITQYHAIWVFL